jgi:hypothetical protein
VITIGDSCCRRYAPPKIDSRGFNSRRGRARASLAGRARVVLLGQRVEEGKDVLPLVGGAAYEHGHHACAGLAFELHAKNLRAIQSKRGTITQWKMTTARRQAENITPNQRNRSMNGVDVASAVLVYIGVAVLIFVIGAVKLYRRAKAKEEEKQRRRL